MRISHIIRGQEHLSNAFKHALIFEAAGIVVRIPDWWKPQAPPRPQP